MKKNYKKYKDPDCGPFLRYGFMGIFILIAWISMRICSSLEKNKKQ
jgi:hypothetical protein